MCDFLEDAWDSVTGFFNDNIVQPLERMVTPPGTGGLEAAKEAQDRQTQVMREGNEIARQSSEKAMQMQEDALKRASAASVPLADSESARRASEQRMRRLLGSGAFGNKGGKKLLGEAPVGYKMLTGE